MSAVVHCVVVQPRFWSGFVVAKYSDTVFDLFDRSGIAEVSKSIRVQCLECKACNGKACGIEHGQSEDVGGNTG